MLEILTCSTTTQLQVSFIVSLLAHLLPLQFNLVTVRLRSDFE